MVLIAPRFSAAKALASASLSCAARDLRLMRRPENTSGSTMTGMAASTSAGELRARHHHHGDGAEKQEQIAQGHRGGRPEGRFQLGRVGGQPRYELARLGRVVERRIEAAQMLEQVGPQVGDDPLAERHDQVIPAGRRKGQHGHHRRHGAEIGVDQPGLVGREAEIDHATHGFGHRQRRGRGQRERRDGGGDAALVAPNVGKQRHESPHRGA